MPTWLIILLVVLGVLFLVSVFTRGGRRMWAGIGEGMEGLGDAFDGFGDGGGGDGGGDGGGGGD